ncbi:DUF2214 domain-containing protein [Neorhizobium sp. T786]|uniref:DUF6644 family protein n=1 Tax=Pseudorhizobium xiangyangii TaxID=2883104 RepID=UPI001CFF74D1|nr:DUF6644 family protein [Neorhizobium xiangyangii]MCB5202940.1 DUF2214 domain-containing protein [Neorhizobium xiangyangii]
MEWLALLAETPLARALIVSPTVYLLVNAAHIMAIGMLFGSILALDLRLLGLFEKVPLQTVAVFLSRMAGKGVALAVLTGLCLFSVKPTEYIQNTAFLAKLGLVALGIGNALVVHVTPGWRAAVTQGSISAPLRVSAVISLVIWISAIVAGRWIGFL